MTRAARDTADLDYSSLPGSPGPPDPATGLSLQNSIYRQTIAVCDRLADAALRGSDADELTAVFAVLVRKSIVVLDAALQVRAQAGGGPEGIAPRWHRSDRSVDRLISALEVERRPLRVPPVPGSALEHGCLITLIAVGPSTLGYLLVLEETDAGEPDDVDLLTTTYAATLFALTLAHERTSTELGLRYKRAVANALVSGHFLDPRDAELKAHSLGLPAGGPYRVAAIRVAESAATERVTQALADHLSSANGAVALTRDAQIIAIVPELERSPRSGGHEAAATLARLSRQAGPGTPATIGLSEVLDRPDAAPQGLWQAQQAIELGLRLGRVGQVISYDELGIYRLLLRVGDMSQLWSFAEDILGALAGYDQQHQAQLVRTLSEYLRAHARPKQTAAALRLHPNTISYRIQRIEQITGLDLADPDDRLVAHVAVKIVESQARGRPATRPQRPPDRDRPSSPTFAVPVRPHNTG
ncbi:hypothetical protein BH20ACT5_BH20ACT5_18210 [soil metagenome]